MIKLRNRRYIGCKQKLVDRIFEIVSELAPVEEYPVFADIFAGTGVVAEKFKDNGYNVIVNDLLKHNVSAYNTWFSNGEFDEVKILNILEKFNNLRDEDINANYFSDVYSGKYFSFDNAKRIGKIRDDIESLKSELTEREYNILNTSLMYAVDKIANTVGHFEHYLSTPPKEKKLLLQMPEISNIGGECEIYNEDANTLVRNIACDIAYIDPPYNARQYVNFYHTLENLINWNKPTEFEGISMKFKRNHLKSEYSRAKAPIVFEDLINNIDARYIIVSYNNTYKANSIASNNKITQEQLISILDRKGNVTYVELEHKFFNAGKTNFKEHVEYIYICEVDQ